MLLIMTIDVDDCIIALSDVGSVLGCAGAAVLSSKEKYS